MKVTRDEPGRLLVLEGTATPRPAWLLAGPGLLVAVAFLASRNGGLALPSALEAAVLLVGGIAMALLWVRVSWRTTLLHVDAGSATLRMDGRNVMTGQERSEIVPHSGLLGLDVRSVRPPGHQVRPGQALPVQLAFRFASGNATRSRRFDVTFEDADKREEVADMAYRIGAAAGLPYQRVIHSDPRQIQIEMGREGGAGSSPMPAIAGRARYQRDKVDPAARVAIAQDVVPSFDPSRFTGPYRVTVWDPGREVRIQRPLLLTTLASLVAVSACLLAPAAAIVAMWLTRATLAAAIFLSVFAAVGVGLGVSSWTRVRQTLPRRVLLDWTGGKVSVAGYPGRREHPLGDVLYVELRCIRQVHRTRRGRWTGYRCEIVAGLENRDPMVLAVTREVGEPDPPYRQALPLATDLAKALRVPRRVVDFD